MSRTYILQPQGSKTSVIVKDAINKINCKCGLPAVERVSKKDNENKGKKFLTCKDSKCKFFQWLDKPVETNNSKRKINDSNSSNTIEDLLYSLGDKLDTIHIYTDGCCIGNRNVANSTNPAGWGVVITSKDINNKNNSGLVVTEELFGPVVIDQNSSYFIGARVASNNTGELCAIGEALLWLRDYNNNNSSPVIIRYDSEYAAKSVLGIYDGEKNRELIVTIRNIFEEVKKHRKVEFMHVKGHSNDKLNDRADTLANQGALGKFCTTGRFREVNNNNNSSSINNNNCNSTTNNNNNNNKVIDLVSDDSDNNNNENMGSSQKKKKSSH